MLKSFREYLTALADLAIIIACIFVFIAFITPKELTFESIQDLRQNAAINLANLGNARNALDDNETNINSLEDLISELNSSLSEQSADIDPTQIESLVEEIENAKNRLSTALSQNDSLTTQVARIERIVDSDISEIENLQKKASYTPYWAQGIRNNLDDLITAIGLDGLVAGFASLIFCLVCNRRRDWVAKFFRFFSK